MQPTTGVPGPRSFGGSQHNWLCLVGPSSESFSWQIGAQQGASRREPRAPFLAVHKPIINKDTVESGDDGIWSSHTYGKNLYHGI